MLKQLVNFLFDMEFSLDFLRFKYFK